MIYVKIANFIRREVIDSNFVVGDLLPTEMEFVAMYSVSRGTIRKALKTLEDEGLVERRHGSGTYLSKRVTQTITGSSEVLGFTKTLLNSSGNPSSQVLKFEVIESSAFISKMLEIEPRAPVYFAKRLRLDNNTPLQIEETWMSVERFPLLSYSHLMGSKYDFIEKLCGVKIKGVFQSITPVTTPEEYSGLLMLSTKDPVLMMATQAIDENEKPLDYSVLYTNHFNYETRYYFPNTKVLS